MDLTGYPTLFEALEQDVHLYLNILLRFQIQLNRILKQISAWSLYIQQMVSHGLSR